MKCTYLDLLSLLSLLLLLCLGNGSLARLCTDSRRLVPAGCNGSKVSTDNTTLVLDSSPRALLGDLFRNTLLVHATEDDCPCDLTRVLALEEKRFVFRGSKAEDLVIDYLAHGMANRILCMPCCHRERRLDP